jgi:hypothetical protein
VRGGSAIVLGAYPAAVSGKYDAMADDDVTIDWGAASVDGGRLTVPLAGKPPAGFKPALAHVIERLERGGRGWGEVKVAKAKLRVDDVRDGSESDLRHFLEAAVLQANADVRADEEDDDEAGDGDERSEPDQAMTDAFRGFAPDGD